MRVVSDPGSSSEAHPSSIAIEIDIATATNNRVINNNNSSPGIKRRRSRRRRPSLLPPTEGTSVLEFTKAEWKEMNPSLPSLLLPWAFLVVMAVSSTVFKYSDAFSDPLDFDLSEGSLERMMLLEDSTGSSIAYDFSSGGAAEQDHHSFHSDHRNLGHHHHPALFPLTTSDYLGFFLATIGLMVAAGGGIGGGGILVPIFSLVHGFSAKHAIPLSNVTVFGGAVANTLLNARKRHPLADRPLVDWDLILVMEPLTIGGALIGAFLNKVLPEAILMVMLVILLSFTAYSSLTKAVKMYKIESMHLREQGFREDGTKESELTRLAHDQDDDVDASESLLEDAEYQESDDIHHDEDNNDNYKSSKNASQEKDVDEEDMEEEELLETEASKKEQLAQILEEERIVPKTNIQILVVMFIVVLAMNLLKGGGAFRSPIGIVCGSKSFWIANALMLGWIITISLFVRAYLVNRYRIKHRVGYQYVEGDIKWDPRATIVYPSVCCLAGFFAGMFGVGEFCPFLFLRAEYSCNGDVDCNAQVTDTFFFVFFMSCRRWDCQGTTDAGHGCASSRFLGGLGMYDSIHELYSHHILCRIWLVGI